MSKSKEFVVTGMHVVFWFSVVALIFHAIAFVFLDDITWWPFFSVGLLFYSGYELKK